MVEDQTGGRPEIGSDHDPASLSRIREIILPILSTELGLTPDKKGFLHFKINEGQNQYEYIRDVLSELNTLTKVADLTIAVNKKYPFLEITESAVRSAILREKDIFTTVGRSSTYGLKKWEKERKDIRGGTIRDLVEEYLEGEADPKHISEISEYVNKFRQTTLANVKANIELNEERFKGFSGDYFGLPGKEYKNMKKRSSKGI